MTEILVTRRRHDTKRLANTPCRPLLDFIVPRDGRILARIRIYPNIVFAAMVAKMAAALA
jgi:hypothetical protein